MSNRYLSLYINIGKKRSLVIDAERKDAMLVWKLKCRAENGAVGRLRYRYKVKTVVGRKHRELKLQSVRRVDLERTEMIVRVFRYLDIECLPQRLAHSIVA